MVADFQAHAFYLSEARGKMGLPGYFDMAQGELPKRQEAGLTVMSLQPETLRGLKTVWEEHKQERMAIWRAKHDVDASEPATGRPPPTSNPVEGHLPASVNLPVSE
jgi:hypothetical protein